MEPSALADAVSVFRQAGHKALVHQEERTDWWQFYVEFPDWTDAEQTAAVHLAPLMRDLKGSSAIAMWWFIRKHPCWRLCLYGGPEHQVRGEIGARLDELVEAGRLHRWCPSVYEPETAAFGGGAGMMTAHRLFSEDSHHILARHGRTDVSLGRRELSVLLCTVMMQAAGLEWQEQGDVWDRVINEAHRTATGEALESRLEGMTRQIRSLLVSDTTQDGAVFGEGGPLHSVAEWAMAFRRAGAALKEGVDDGSLDRGIRRVLAHHIIVHWNRVGLSHGAQSALALAARAAILETPAGE
ncbi:methyltransferase [Streptomyces kanamyceticus]|uniref:Methyltransferase n=2 Tax=Streptomyces kanamyceticus TaxID=1967 RepID=A0A5J6GSZ3_STRKN|nr:methyltransferase [Streptomyces kanamyceticus]